ncbi:hypothetical protein BN14_04087 [Rhizoctonia solani AG-1 IB]|uniref:Uncharacterized protein n=1 Tax=Thanatephorus cucumeris (strain AG1-IB / isolate 7/3/14) TaxID=1108050 RepID=M5BQI2_THACB|nr:hypothetical protein BN14_04087 [Rhizoctonia solani AG-1 IB]
MRKQVRTTTNCDDADAKSWLSSPAPSDAGSTGSSKSVRISESDDHMKPGQYAPHAPIRPPKKVLKHVWPEDSLFDDSVPIRAAQLAIEDIFIAFIRAVKHFKCPQRLTFSLEFENVLVLVNAGKNVPFIEQLTKLGALRTALANIPTHGHDQVIDRHQVAVSAVERAILKMRDHQITLYLDFIHQTFICYVETFTFPSELGFSSNMRDASDLPHTRRKMIIIDQFNKLDVLRARLAGAGRYAEGQLKDKLMSIDNAIVQFLQEMAQHCDYLYEIVSFI